MLDRRAMVGGVLAGGAGLGVFFRAVVAAAQEADTITADMVRQAEWIAGLTLTDDERDALAASLNGQKGSIARLRECPIDYADNPATHFAVSTLPPPVEGQLPRAVQPLPGPNVERPSERDQLAFLTVAQLAALVASRQVSSRELTEMYLERLRRYDPLIKCVVTLTEDTALAAADRADAEIAAGRYRGPLHGIPWGAKDLIAVSGYPTTWGVPGFRERQLAESATVAQRLEAAGAVLVAKLSLGALAMGDRWFGGMTRNPWNPVVGSSGSSAGSSAAVVAGLVGFALGSETLGSIVSPCRRCGATGLRPTFGRVSRHGCMALSWTMDKIGPICRSVQDCALVFAAIHGADGRDPTAVDAPFSWPPAVDFHRMRVGYTPNDTPAQDREDLRMMADIGLECVEVRLPDDIPDRSLTDIIDVEGAAVFDQLLRQGETEGWNEWPGIFRRGQMITAVDYLRMQRARRRLMAQMDELMASVDVLVNVPELVITNLTGHPSVVFPTGYRNSQGERRIVESAVVTGRLWDEMRLLAVAQEWQSRIAADDQHPPLDALAGDMDLPPRPTRRGRSGR